MRTSDLKASAILKAAMLVACLILFGAGASFGQQTINLTAAPTTTTLPDGTTVPMWGYFCGAAVSGTTATCGPLNPASAPMGGTATWSPVLITVPYSGAGTSMTINLTNSLSFTPVGATSPNIVPTSIIIAGQVGGGLGSVAQRTTTPSPNHGLAQGCETWFIASGATPPGTPCPALQAGANVPPAQGPRVQSFATEVAAGGTTSLAWNNLVPGTYLLESGTHPSIQVPMGLIGMLVVTTAPSGTTAGTAYPAVGTAPAVPYNAELPVEFSEIDPVQNKAVNAAVNTPGFNETNMKTFGDGVTAINVTSGGSGYASNPAVTITGGGGSGATATAVVGAVITGVTLSSGGSGYAAGTTVTIAAPGGSGTTATAIANLNFLASPVTVTAGGSGYAVGDVVTFTGGGVTATGTVASVTTTGTLGTILTVNSPSAGISFPAAPTVSSIFGTRPVATVAVTSGGSGYTAGEVLTLTGGGGSGATATVGTVSGTGAIQTISLTTPGSGFTTAPTGSTGATGTGAVLATTLVAQGTGATLTLPTSGSINSITITNGGSLYTTPVAASAVTISAPAAGGTAAVVGSVTTAGTTGSVYSVEITNSGTRYGTAPTVSIAAGTTTATAVASLSQSCTSAGSNSIQAVGTASGCYPSAVNYTPFYYLINGLAFNKTNPSLSLFAATAGVSTTTGLPVTTGIPTAAGSTVLVRIVNAGLRMHVPSIVGSLTQGFTGAGVAGTVGGFTLVAEDGNVVPGLAPPGGAFGAGPRVQTDVFMAAGKVFDVMINVPATATAPALPIYDRELSLSGNSSTRDAGMIAYIGVNGAGLPAGAPTLTTAGTGVFAAAAANPDVYNGLAAGQPFSVTDVSKGVIANDVNVYGVQLLKAPTNGTLSCGAQFQNTIAGICANGTFTYTPNAGSTATSDSFTYCANNGYVPASGTTAASCSPATLMATVTLGGSSLTGNPTAVSQAYTAKTSTYIKIPSPGLLAGNTDPSGLPITVVVPTTQPAGVVMDAQGGFTATVTSGTASLGFSYTVQNSQGRTATGTATVTFPTPSNLVVNVVDAQALRNCQGDTTCINALIAAPITDYRWIIEEDRTFWVDPNCTTNTSISTAGCPGVVPGPAGTTTVPAFGVNFHASTMPFVAQGCTGPLSCESGQTMLDTRATVPGATAGTTVPNPTLGQHIPAVCDLGNGACRPDPNCATLPCLTSSTVGGSAGGYTYVQPGSVHLDPTKRYYISVLPGDAANPFPSNTTPPNCSSGPISGTGTTATLNTACGHTMSGAPVPPACNILVAGCTATSTTATFAPVTVAVLPTPLPPGKLSVMVFEDDFPLNGEQDAGGGVDVLSPQEPGLGGFNIVLWDSYGNLGDVTGQNSYDMFNMPLANSLAGTIDPLNGNDACPISANSQTVTTGAGASQTVSTGNLGITGMIVTCPKYESDNKTLSPLAGQAIIANLMPEKFNVQAYPGADRIARGEEWIQTNTLDGQHQLDSFIRIGEPSYFQEFGPAGYHVSIGFANPKIINARHDAVCAGNFGAVGPCTNTITGQVNVQRNSRTPDQRLYPSGSHDGYAWTQCWVSLGDPDAEDFMFVKCDANGNFKFTNVPGGNWRLTIGDQWNDQIIDGLSTPANVGCIPVAPATTCSGGLSTLNMGSIGVQQWQSNIYTTVFIDDNKNGIKDPGEIGLPLSYVMVHYRDGHNANALTTDFNGVANFNETFPLFNWYVVEADDSSTATRYKTTGIHTVYDAAGPADGSTYCGNATNGARPCGTSTAYNFLANTFEAIPLPGDLSVPGAVYCAKADCLAEAAGFAAGTAKASSATASTGRLDPPWVVGEAWSGLTSHSEFIEFGKAPYAACPPACVSVPNAVANSTAGGTTASTIQVGENGGIHGKVTYASTRPFDDADQMIQQPWAPNVPNVTVNLYQEGFAADGVTSTLKLVDTTQTSSWDDWAQGFYPGSTAGAGTGAGQKPYMSCPGQGTAAATSPNQDLFFYTLNDQPNFLDAYNAQHNGGTPHTLPYNSQFKCYDAMHIGDQLQPAPFDGQYAFPSSLGINPTTGKPITPAGYLNPITGLAPAMTGTNCTICVLNPDTTDVYRVGTPMLPPGKYVVEVIMPPGYEVYKEEDKNLLIGDNYIAPATQQFAGLGGSIFIIPDQASVASMYDPTAAGYNPNNFQDPTTALGLGDQLSGVPGFPGFQNPVWPCVGEMRVVPDYLSLFPQAKEVAPFAGATRPICDRKEVTLANQTSADAKFFIFTSTHIASKYTGVITDDFTSEFDPFAPQFGEKFAPPNLPISTKDYLGNEISRVYTDQFGLYDGLTFSSWEVNPPNITGYSPTMMVQCMNDAGPIIDTRAQIPNPANPSTLIANPTFGQLINDPLYNSAYSQFCYEEPYMPGVTTYLDTPVVPTQAFVGAGYNNVDCAYPDATPAIKEVDGDGVGPWVSAGGHTLTITALGDQMVGDEAYSGPSASVAPFNATTIKRHYGFGTGATVTIGGVPQTCSGSDLSLTCSVTLTATVGTGANAHSVSVPPCPIQQQTQYGGSAAQCGELVITAANGRQSVDAVTVTIGGKTPTHVAASASVQSAIDAAAPGDLIIVDPTCTTGTGTAATVVACTTAGATKTPGSHSEMLIMWKPVRLQGVGAPSTIINANTHPAGKLLDPWRRHINCLFGLTLQGAPDAVNNTGTNHSYDPTGTFSCPDTGWNYFTAQLNNPPTSFSNPQVDRVPSEGLLGWDATLNGNLAELLQEPSLMGAYEGAGVTVLAKGVDMHGGNGFDPTLEGAFPTGTTLLTGVVSNPGGPAGTTGALSVGDANALCHTSSTNTTNPFPSNYICNPSSIDGLSITNSSQGGGGIFIHGWAHYLQVANNRIFNNAGTLSGGISVGQGEFGPANIQGQQGTATFLPPGSCSDGTGFVTNQHLPWCLDVFVNVHHNGITQNSSLGDELFSATLSGGGGGSVCTGSDYYKFNFNWICGNESSGEGGGLVHLGETFNGTIQHNTLAFNQSINPTIPTNGGGIMVEGTPDTDPVCPGVPDADCPSGLSDGTGLGLLIDANLIQGNSADSGSGGGIRLQQVNGTEVGTFASQPQHWNNVTITNNIIVNNMAGWDGAGISLQDALNVNIINNTIMHNDTLASSGVLTNSIGTPQASAPAGNCVMARPTGPTTASCPQSAGVTSTLNSSLMITATNGLTVTCPPGHPNCTHFSNPILYNDIIQQNRAFYIGVGPLGAGTQNQQNVVSLYEGFTTTLAPNQATTGACISTPAPTTAPYYWDLGVRGDTGPTNHSSGFTLAPIWSDVPAGDGYNAGQGNITGNPAVTTSYCNGSRVPPECTVTDGCGGPHGFGVPPGIADAVTPNPVFSLTPSATVDEGNNWINVSWGPLSLANDAVLGADGNYGGGLPLGNYVQTAGSPVNNAIPCPGNARPCVPPGFASGVTTPLTDFFGNPRPDGNGSFDIGAVELQTGGGGGGGAAGTLSFTSATNGTLTTVLGVRTLTFTIPAARTPVTSVVTITNTAPAGSAALTITTETLTLNVGSLYSVTGNTCTTPVAVGGTCTVSITYATPATAPLLPDIGALTVASNGTVTSSPLALIAR
jgi:hypothetical protein